MVQNMLAQMTDKTIAMFSKGISKWNLFGFPFRRSDWVKPFDIDGLAFWITLRVLLTLEEDVFQESNLSW